MIKFNDEIIEQKTFPDGTPSIKQPSSLPFYSGEQTILWKYENMSELFNLYSLVKQIRDYDKNENIQMKLVLPYVPNSRQDRVKNKEEDIFTLKWFCEIINSLNFTKIMITDVHSLITPALLNNCFSLSAELFIAIAHNKINNDIVDSKDCIDLYFYPDYGSVKKYSEYINFPYVFGIKNRDWKTGKILGLDIIGDVKGKNILIVDDICSKGGTFYHSAKKLKELGANKIWLYITHCENTVLKGELINSGLIEKIYTTNSIYTEKNDLIEVIYEF